jgi:hypothetical protein
MVFIEMCANRTIIHKMNLSTTAIVVHFLGDRTFNIARCQFNESGIVVWSNRANSRSRIAHLSGETVQLVARLPTASYRRRKPLAHTGTILLAGNISRRKFSNR